MNKLKLLDLFSGIGGFSLGLESTGFFETIAFVEKDKFCQKVLKKNFNNIPIEEDIRNVRGSNYAADIITGGFPCQPFSVAGKRKGTDDDRYLWDETIRVVAECKPRWFIGENVEGLININNGVVLRQVQTDLEDQGFQVQCLIVPAAGIGAFHQRKRIWIVAYSDSNRYGSKIRGSSTKEERIPVQNREEHSSTRKFSGASSLWNGNNEYVPNSSSKRLQGFNNKQLTSKQELGLTSNKNDENVWNSESTRRESSSMGPGKGKFRGASAWGKQCESNWWKAESKLCGIPDGISATLDKDRSNRIKSLGNSIVPQIARQLGLSIMEAELSG
jgi:DNA (cytosine-5)-methyltransferase 1